MLTALMISGLATRGAWAQCRVVTEKASLKNVAVVAAGQSFTLDLRSVPVTATLEEVEKAVARIEVLAPLHFVASYPAEKLAYRIKLERGVDLYGGRIHLGRKAGHTWLGVRGNGMLLSLQSSMGVEVRQAVVVPCASLELGSGSPYESPLAVTPPAGRTVGTGTAYIPLYSAPRESDGLDIRYAGPFRVLRRHSGWVLLRADWDDGSWVRGWTSERLVSSEAAEPRGWREGGGAEAGCGGADRPVLARVTLRKNALVAASPAGTIWASVAQKTTVDAFPLDRSDGWIQVATVRGLPPNPCSEHQHIWVHARDIIGPVPRSHEQAPSPAAITTPRSRQ